LRVVAAVLVFFSASSKSLDSGKSVPEKLISESVSDIFRLAYRELRPRAPFPPLHIRFYPFVSINNTIRLRQGELYVRLSDLLESAPDSVLHSIGHILLAKLYRQPIDRVQSARYRRYIASREIAAQARLLRQVRGRKHIRSAHGHYYHLEEIFDDLNRRFFHGLMGRPQLTWSRDHARSSLGHYDPAHNTIVISRVFDHPKVPRYAVEYILFHEMLHLKHPVRLRGSRRCVHSSEFRAEEKLFPELERVKKFLRVL
jgi:predicted metal-dependent hydrolase